MGLKKFMPLPFMELDIWFIAQSYHWVQEWRIQNILRIISTEESDKDLGKDEIIQGKYVKIKGPKIESLGAPIFKSRREEKPSE